MGVEQIWNIVRQEFSNLGFTTIGNIEPQEEPVAFARGGTLLRNNAPVGGLRMNVEKGGEVTCTILGKEGRKSPQRTSDSTQNAIKQAVAQLVAECFPEG